VFKDGRLPWPHGPVVVAARVDAQVLQPVAASPSLAGGDQQESQTPVDSIFSVQLQLAYRVSQPGGKFCRASKPSFIVLPTHIPVDALVGKIIDYGKEDLNRTKKDSSRRVLRHGPRLDRLDARYQARLNEISRADAAGRSETRQQAAEMARAQRQSLLDSQAPWKQHWHLAKATLCCYDPLSQVEEEKPWYFKWHCMCPFLCLLCALIFATFVWGCTVFS